MARNRVPHFPSEAFGGSLPNIEKKVASASNSSLDSDIKSKSTTDTFAIDRTAEQPEGQLQQEKDTSPGDEARLLAEEMNRLRERELELEQRQKQLLLQAAELGVDPCFLSYLIDLLRSIANSTPTIKV